MQIFEYYFNPKNEEGKNFKAFLYEPKNPSEKKMGSLYVLGETRTDNSNLLERLFRAIKEKFYHNTTLGSLEKVLPETLKKANEFLAEEVKKENVRWMGNFSFGIFSIKGLDLNFTKTGNFKVLLLRFGKFTDIGKELEKEEMDPYPLKVFFNIVSGKLAPLDILMVVSNEVYFFLKEKEILSKIANLKEYDEKNLKNVFQKELFTEKEGSKISGMCLLFSLNEENSLPREFSFQEKVKTAIAPKKTEIRKNFLIIGFLLILLFFGFLIFKKEKTDKKEEFIPILETLEEESILFHLEKTEYKNDLTPLFQLNSEAEKIIVLGERIFALSFPDSIYEIKTGNQEKLNIPGEFLSASKGKDTVFFISKEKGFFSLKEEEVKIEEEFDLINFYGSNLYFMSKNNCQIFKYSFANNDMTSWFKQKKENQTCLSFAIDGSIWLLSKENTLDLYHEGEYQKSIELPEGITDIKTSFNHSFIYLLYPKGQRIIVLDKEGNLIKQIKSEQFNKLKDIQISEDKESIFILSENKIYKIGL